MQVSHCCSLQGLCQDALASSLQAPRNSVATVTTSSLQKRMQNEVRGPPSPMALLANPEKTTGPPMLGLFGQIVEAISLGDQEVKWNDYGKKHGTGI